MTLAVRRYWSICDSIEMEANSVNEAIDIAHAMPVERNKAEFVPDSINSDPSDDVQSLTTGGGT